MNITETDKKIKEALLKGTEGIDQYKNEVWNHIERSLKENDEDTSHYQRTQKNKTFKVSTLMKVAAAILIIFILGTSKPGVEVIAKVKKLFVPQKQVVQQIEGETEKHEVNLKELTSGYVIYIDDSYFNLEHLDGRDKITPKNKLTDPNFPEMYMEIKQVDDRKPSDLFSSLTEELKAQYKFVNKTGEVTQPIEALRISATAGKNPNSKDVIYYVIDNKKGGSFLITEQIFIEAEEGMGARFDNILKEFKISE